MSSRFRSIVSSIPMDINDLTGEAVSFFFNKQSPGGVEFVAYDDGYVIKVKGLSSDDVESAKEFWTNHVLPHI